MNRKKTQDVDIFQRSLCCNPIRDNDKEIEIFEAASVEIEEEEEMAIFEENEKIDTKLLVHELECMKRRIEIIQLHLKFDTNECPAEECVDYEVLLNCSQNKEICALQKDQNMLQHQNTELIKCFQVAKEQIQNLEMKVCEQNQEIIKLNESMEILMEWKNTLQHEFGKCLERFEYLKHVKAEWRDVNEKLQEQDKLCVSLQESFVPKECFMQENEKILNSINEIKEMFKELYQYQCKRFASLEKHLPKKDLNSQEANDL